MPMKLERPTSCKIGPFLVEIRWHDRCEEEANRSLGYWRSRDQVISITDSISPARQAQTLLHEILHGCWWLMETETRDKEERIVSTLATGLALVLQDNPDVFRWIEHNLKIKNVEI